MDLNRLYQETQAKRRDMDYRFIFKWKRQPDELWQVTRERVWHRDKGFCQSPLSATVCKGKLEPVNLKDCHIDHIRPISKGGSNHHSNLRVLCPVCHALRLDESHRSLVTRLLKKNLLPSNYSQYYWE